MPQTTTSSSAPAGQQPAQWYAIRRLPARAQAQQSEQGGAAVTPQAEAEILIYGDIGESWWTESVSAAQFVKELAALDVSAITVRIASIGGSVPDGIAIYNAIKRHKASVTCVVDSMAMSVASLIAIAGDQVHMAENAVLMIHAPWTWADGNAAQLRELADMLDVWARAMATSYAAKTGQTVDDVLPLLTDGVDHYYTASEAQAAGFVDALISATPVAAMARPASASAARLPAAIAARLGLPSPQASTSHSAPGARASSSTESDAMPSPTNAPAAQPTAADIDAARAAGVKAEAERRSAIEASAKPFAERDGMPAVIAACLADPAVTALEADRRILAHLAKGAASVGQVVTVEDERDKFRAGATQALLARAAAVAADGKVVRVDASNPWRGLGLMDMARAALQRAGINAAGMDRMQVVAAAFTQSTSDFPVLLENAMYKTLQGAYAIAPDTWSRFCARGSVVDFRVNPRYRVGSLSNLDAKSELGEFRTKAIPDGEKATIQAGTKGNLINISREAIVNDDLGAFIGLSNMLGRAAKRTVEADVYALLASNPTLSDGKALFHADHGNLAGTGAAPTVVSVDAARMAMLGQKDVSGNEYLDMRPAVALAPVSLGSTLRVLNAAEYDPDTANKLQRPNVVRGLFRDVVESPRLGGTAWYLFADPSDAPVIEVAFLEGNDTPYLEQQQGWTVDGTQFKVRLDFGVAAVDYRGAYKQPGA